MSIEIMEIREERLFEYAKIPIAFEVKSVYQIDLINNGIGGMTLTEKEVVTFYMKDYDSYEDGSPENWVNLFNMRNWGFFLVIDNNKAIGGATVAFNTPEIRMLDGRKDLTVLWDIRVRPEYRYQGIGTMLFKYAVNWSKKKGCRQMKIETQNVNVSACKFYVKQGCKLGAIDRYGYFGHPKVSHEAMLLWYLDL